MSPSRARIAFVTGLNGQDGSYLAERLTSEETEIHALTMAGQPSPAWAGSESVIWHVGDLTDVGFVRALVREIAPDEIYNLAAISSVAQSWEVPEQVAQVNGAGAVALMESAYLAQEAQGRPISFIQASSAEIFGAAPGSPQDENTPLRPINPYGAAKAYAHMMAAIYRTRGLAASSLILYNHESPRRPDKFVTRKITAGVAAIAAGRSNELRLGNLDAIRDWGWAPDFVDAMVRAARATSADDYVIATGVGHTVRDFVAAAFAAAGAPDWEQYVQVDPAFFRPSEAVALVGNPAKAAEILGWRPTMDFNQVVAVMVRAES